MNLSKTNKNFFYNFIYEIVIVLAPLIVTPYVSRVLGAELIGVRSYTYTILTYFELFSNLGIAIYGQREIAKVADDKEKRSQVFLELIIIKIISFSAVLCVYCAVFFCAGVLSEYKIIFGIWIVHLCESFFNIAWLFQGMEKFKYISIRGVIIRTLQVILTLLLVKDVDDFYLYVFLYALFPLLSAISLWPFLVKTIDFKQIKNIKIQRHFKYILIFFIPTIATTLYSNIDKLMLGSISTMEVEGYYESAQHIINIATTICASVYVVMRSRISAIHGKDESQLNNILKYFISLSLMIAIPVMFGIIAVSDKFVIAFFGEGYEPVIKLLMLFSPIILIMGFTGLISAVYIVPYDKQKFLTIFYIAAAAINFVLDAVLIPLLGAEGAIVGSLAAELVVCVGCFVLSRKFISAKLYLKYGWKYLLAGIIMFAAVYSLDLVLGYSIINLLLEIVIGVVVYFIALIIFRDEFVFKALNKIFKIKSKK